MNTYDLWFSNLRVIPPVGLSDWVTEEFTLVLVQTTEDLGHLGLTPILGISQVMKIGHITTEHLLNIFVVDHMTSNTGTDFAQQVVVTDWDLKSQLKTYYISIVIPWHQRLELHQLR